jgi:hypothetical protein
MSIRRRLIASAVALSSLSSLPASAHPYRKPPVVRDDYRAVLEVTVGMVQNADAQRLADARGLDILNVTWEDTGRYKNSSVGPNISDMTIQVAHKDARGHSQLFLMPVIRFPNFSDRSADLRLDRFHLLVGNEDGDSLRKVSLKDILANVPAFLHDPSSWKGRKKSLLVPRDTHALVSAQAAFLPIPAAGDATFNPVLFNYQSVVEDPAVLTILATREGTSITIIDNERDGFSAGGSWGQRLFFNKDGERAPFTGKRLSDWKLAPDGAPSGPSTNEAGLNMVLLIQVPLKQKRPMRFDEADDAGLIMPSAPMNEMARAAGGSDVENAVIGHGEVEGPFTETDWHIEMM